MLGPRLQRKGAGYGFPCCKMPHIIACLSLTVCYQWYYRSGASEPCITVSVCVFLRELELIFCLVEALMKDDVDGKRDRSTLVAVT